MQGSLAAESASPGPGSDASDHLAARTLCSVLNHTVDQALLAIEENSTDSWSGRARALLLEIQPRLNLLMLESATSTTSAAPRLSDAGPLVPGRKRQQSALRKSWYGAESDDSNTEESPNASDRPLSLRLRTSLNFGGRTSNVSAVGGSSNASTRTVRVHFRFARAIQASPLPSCVMLTCN